MRSLFSKHHTGENDNDPYESAQRVPGSTIGTQTRQKRVLVMDDDAFIRGVVRAILSESGYGICVAKNGMEAIKLFTEAKDGGTSFDVVLLDLHLPSGLGGDGVFEVLREKDPTVRAVLMTADINHPAVAQYEILGFKSVVIKPFTRRDILHALHYISETSSEERKASSET